MDTWIEVEDTYLTNQPLIWSGKGKNRKRIPDPDEPPTEAYLFLYRCKQTKRGISRSRGMKTISSEVANLEEAIISYMNSDNVILIEAQDRPLDYIKFRGRPKVVPPKTE